MLEIETWKFIIGIIVIAVIWTLIGYRLGKENGTKPTAGGIIDIEPGDEGGKRCTFKLEGDIDWIEKQEYIVFQVRSQSQKSHPV